MVDHYLFIFVVIRNVLIMFLFIMMMPWLSVDINYDDVFIESLFMCWFVPLLILLMNYLCVVSVTIMYHLQCFLLCCNKFNIVLQEKSIYFCTSLSLSVMEEMLQRLLPMHPLTMITYMDNFKINYTYIFSHLIFNTVEGVMVKCHRVESSLILYVTAPLLRHQCMWVR
jgi:hypothetical protein